jgi:hypothetical protein
MKWGLQRCSAALLLVVALAASVLAVAQTDKPVAGAEHVRGAEQTLLTFPEWFLVFSPNEYAEFTANRQPSRFPYYGHIGQFWESYLAVTDESSRRELDFNPGYHMMIMIIGVSTTVEYALRSAYERLIGRLSEVQSAQPTAEDRYAAKVAKDYVAFIRVLPWYEYDFAGKLRDLWTETGYAGPGQLRKWERKFALSTEYGFKMLYGKLIKFGTRSVYEAPLLVTAVVTRTVPAPDPKMPELKVLQILPDGRTLITVPRYEAFMVYAQALAAKGLNFEEIAGNRTFILVSLLTKRDWTAPLDLPVLFVQPILTRPDRQRVALMVPVNRLAMQLRQWQTAGPQVEHIFDY